MSIARLAPSPTGALHLGNARTFLVNWLLARQRGWRIILRVEDLDGPRTKAGADRQAIEDLQWLGIDWDEGPIYQTGRLGKYDEAVQSLLLANKAYPCICSRKEVEQAASAPHREDNVAIYPGTCRGNFASMQEARERSGKLPAVRFRVGNEKVAFEDQLAGHREFDVGRQLGDFVIAKADGTAAYQLAVVVDDAEMGVSEVVRGDDLLDSTPRQILLYRALGWAQRIPRYWHLPLVVGEDGRRLAKRHGDTRLSFYRDKGVPPGRLRGLLARWCGIDRVHESIEMRELLELFRIEKLPRQQIIFRADDDEWLRNR